MTRRRGTGGDLLQPEVTEPVAIEIETTYRYLRRRALVGRLSPQAGTVFEQADAWRSCMDLVSRNRADPPPNSLPPRFPGLPDRVRELVDVITDTARVSDLDDEDFLDGLVVALEVLKRTGQLLSIPRSSLEKWNFEKEFAYVYNDEKAETLIARALDGDLVAYDVVRALARDYLLAEDAIMPTNLKHFVLLEMYDLGKPKQKERKKLNPAMFAQRDLELAKAVSDVIDRTGYKPYGSRNPIRRPQPSATWIVWRAAERLKLGVEHRHVEECWRLRTRLVPAPLLERRQTTDSVLVTLDGEVVWSERWSDPDIANVEAPQIGIGSRYPLPPKIAQ